MRVHVYQNKLSKCTTCTYIANSDKNPNKAPLRPQPGNPKHEQKKQQRATQIPAGKPETSNQNQHHTLRSVHGMDLSSLKYIAPANKVGVGVHGPSYPEKSG